MPIPPGHLGHRGRNQPTDPLAPRSQGRGLRLDLGCGNRRQEGFVRVDVMTRCEPDVLLDLERFPWPFEDDSAVEVRLHHVLEHLGSDAGTFLRVIQELYRICRDGATVDVAVPHPRHDTFLADPTHVRPILLDTLLMFSKRHNLLLQSRGHANTPLALHLDVDFEIVTHEHVLDRRWQERVDAGSVTREQVRVAATSDNNVIEELRATLRVHKDPPAELARRCLAADDAAGCIDVCLRAVEVDPEDADLWFLLATAMSKQGQIEGAELGLRRTLALRPDQPGALSDLAAVLRKRGELASAMELVDRALSLAEDHAAARSQQASLLAAMGEYDQAVEASTQLVSDHPRHTGFRTNLGNHLRQAHRVDEAVVQLQLAADAAPSDASARWNLALGLFQAGQTRDAFQAAEARYRRPHMPTPEWIDRMWNGQPHPDQTLLLEAEQGFGDALQFVRFAHDAARGGTHVVVRCHERLIPLLSTAPGVSAAIPKDREIAYDHVAWLMSVPAILGLDDNALARPGAYLAPDPARADPFLGRLPEAVLHIGVSWQGNPEHDDDRNRSFALADLAPLAALPGVRLVSLQKGPGSEQIGTVDLPITNLGPQLDADSAFVDTAALLSHLDLVITCDSALGHLAGALDVPCFLALPYAPDWRWRPGSETSGWYRNHTLFHQPSPRDWSSVFRHMAARVQASPPSERERMVGETAPGGGPPGPRRR